MKKFPRMEFRDLIISQSSSAIDISPASNIEVILSSHNPPRWHGLSKHCSCVLMWFLHAYTCEKPAMRHIKLGASALGNISQYVLWRRLPLNTSFFEQSRTQHCLFEVDGKSCKKWCMIIARAMMQYFEMDDNWYAGYSGYVKIPVSTTYWTLGKVKACIMQVPGAHASAAEWRESSHMLTWAHHWTGANKQQFYCLFELTVDSVRLQTLKSLLLIHFILSLSKVCPTKADYWGPSHQKK